MIGCMHLSVCLSVCMRAFQLPEQGKKKARPAAGARNRQPEKLHGDGLWEAEETRDCDQEEILVLTDNEWMHYAAAAAAQCQSSDLKAAYRKVDRPAMEAWYMDDSDEDQRLPHHLDPPQYVSHEALAKLGVLHWVLNAVIYEDDPELEKIRADRGYSYKDIITVSPDKLPNYEHKIRNFFEEHIHLDEEIRYCLEGSGYFDVRDAQDRWIRIWVKKGDMIVLPAGSYHRFTLDANNYIKAMRLFVGEPLWTPYNRPQDDHQTRKDYVNHFLQGQQDAVIAH